MNEMEFTGGVLQKKRRDFVYKALFCSTNHRTNIHAQPYTFYNMVITTSNAAVLLATFVAGAAGHGSMIMPPSRNSVDASPGMPWAGGKHPETGLIEP